MGHMVDINSTITDGYLRSDSSEGSSFVLLSTGKVDTISSAKKRRQRGGVWCKITAKKTGQGFVGGSRDWAIGLGVLRQNSLSLSLSHIYSLSCLRNIDGKLGVHVCGEVNGALGKKHQYPPFISLPYTVIDVIKKYSSLGTPCAKAMLYLASGGEPVQPSTRPASRDRSRPSHACLCHASSESSPP